MEAYTSRWDSISESFFEDICRFLAVFAQSDEASAIDKSRIYESERWGSQYTSVKENVDYAINWFRRRHIWLNKEINELR